MLYWSLMFLFVALTACLLAIVFIAVGARKILPDSATCRIRRTRLGRLNWARGVQYFAIGSEAITIAVRIGFDDNRSLGPQETGGRVALLVFKEIMLRVYREKLVGPVPEFPAQMEQNINDYLTGGSMAKGESLTALDPSNPPAPLSVRFADGG